MDHTQANTYDQLPMSECLPLSSPHSVSETGPSFKTVRVRAGDIGFGSHELDSLVRSEEDCGELRKMKRGTDTVQRVCSDFRISVPCE